MMREIETAELLENFPLSGIGDKIQFKQSITHHQKAKKELGKLQRIGFILKKSNDEDPLALQPTGKPEIEPISYQEAAIDLLRSNIEEEETFAYSRKLSTVLKEKILKQKTQTDENDRILFKRQIDEPG